MKTTYNLSKMPRFVSESLGVNQPEITLTNNKLGEIILQKEAVFQSDNSNESLSLPTPKRLINYGYGILPLLLSRDDLIVDFFACLNDVDNARPIYEIAAEYLDNVARLSKNGTLGLSEEAINGVVAFNHMLGLSESDIPENPSSKENMIKLAHLSQGGTIYSIRDHIQKQLIDTQLHNSVSSGFLQSPESGVIYVECGESRDIEGMPQIISVKNNSPSVDFGAYAKCYETVEGFYIYQTQHTIAELLRINTGAGESIPSFLHRCGYSGFDSVRVVNLHFQASGILPDGKPSKDSGFYFASLYVPIFEDNREISLLELIENHFDYWAQYNPTVAHKNKDENDELNAMLKTLLSFAVINLLYINHTEFRQEVFDGVKAFERLKTAGKKKFDKLSRQLTRRVNRVYIGPSLEDDKDYLDSSRDRRKVKGHLRRGHIRSQAHGEGRALRKTIWIRPKWIGEGGGSGQERNLIFK